MKTSRKIGIIGGTFNPVHYGHLLIAENARQQFELDEIWFMPTGKSPHKKENEILHASKRMKMIELAIIDNPHFKLKSLEVESGEISYTYRTMQKLHNAYPEDRLYFIMGADSLFLFDSWIHPEEICKYCTILAAIRDNVDIQALDKQIAYLHDKYQADIYRLNTVNFYVSSHDIRERVKNGQTVRYLLPEAVLEYIIENDLYKII